MTAPLLAMTGVHLTVGEGESAVPVLRGIDLTVGRGEIVGVVGESGSGKSMTARTIIRSLPFGAQVDGSVRFDGQELLDMHKRDMRKVRAARIGMIFQDPRAGVDPLWTVGDHLTEGMRVHDGLSRREAKDRAIELLAKVGIRDGAQRLRQYPHQLSGGLLQRIVIAGALAGDPELLIADEPTTALDATTQAEIVAIFARLRRERDLGMLFVTHDLTLAATLCDRIVVMYAGRVMEDSLAGSMLTAPAHPYTAALLLARPSMETRAEELAVIPGVAASPGSAPSGCPFRSRCAHATEACADVSPSLVSHGDARTACVRFDELVATGDLSRSA
jgi:oligopeptide/dipeptide ABC transporter ATP-binding protein